MTDSSTLIAADADLPFLTIFKDGRLVESMCLTGLESIVLGRHTNCNLIVTHPSVSRHHLEIQVIHGSRELLLTDLDSIHGTWINGKQALPLVPVTATEGDTIKLGASSRSYTVQWRPRPPQNSTSSEEYSDNSDSPCKGSKHYGAGVSRTTMESCKTSQINSGTASQPACSTKSNNFCVDLENEQEEVGPPEDENATRPLQNNKGAFVAEESASFNCKITQETMLCRPAKVKFAAESLADDENACINKNKASLGDGIGHDEGNGLQGYVKANKLQPSSMDKGEKKVVIDLACFNKGDGRENVQKAKQPSMRESSPAALDLRIDEEESKENIDYNESKQLSTILTSAGANRPPFTERYNESNNGEIVDFQKAKHHGMLESEEASPGFSKLWLRRSKLNPPPNLKTATSPSSTIPLPLKETKRKCLLPSAPPMPLAYLLNSLIPSAPPMPLSVTVGDRECIPGDFQFDDTKENNHPFVSCHQEGSGDVCPNPLSKSAETAEDYVSDKENDSPVYSHASKSIRTSMNKAQEAAHSQERGYSASTEASRRPFQPLALTADGGRRKVLSPCIRNLSGEENSITQSKKRQSPVIQNLDSMLRKLKGGARLEARRAWHIVVDITCFLDSSCFQSLKQLEGIREVRLIIPKIVISELDIRRGMGRPRQKALKWIESCMVKLPAWIHVQSSSENLPIAATPPISPLSTSAASIYSGNFDNMMSPTNGDHVLNCALLFNSTVSSGQVALLTNDIALKIKAMAEGLVCESPSTFCESLLNPYSSRFLWSASIAHGHSWPEKSFHSKSMLALAPSVHSGEQSTKEAVLSTVKAMSFRKNHRVEGLKKECCKQAQGLRVALAN